MWTMARGLWIWAIPVAAVAGAIAQRKVDGGLRCRLAR
jgi:hypothetical protein